MSPSHRRLRLGVIVDSIHTPLWAYQALEQIQRGSYVSLEVLIQDGRGQSAGNLVARLKRSLYGEFLALDRLLFHPQTDAMAERGLHQLLLDLPVIQIRAATEGQTRLGDLKAYDLDFLLHLGLGDVSRDLLGCARHGVLSFQIGEAAGFWEVLEQRTATRVSLYRMSQPAEAPQPVYRVYAATDPYSVSRNRERLFWKMAFILPRALQRFSELGEDGLRPQFEKEIFPFVDKSRSLPSVWHLFHLLVRVAYQRFLRKLWKQFNYEQWILLYSLREKKRLHPAAEEFHKIIPPNQVYWADPFVVESAGRYYVFVEELPYASRKGRIAYFTLALKGEVSRSRTILEAPYHLSYPYVFSSRGDYFMIPESGQHRTIDLYHCLRFPDQWEFVKTIMQDVYAVDTTVFQRGGRWWLFTNINPVSSDPAFGWDELCLFHAPELLSDSWEPHPMNPVISDVRSARPAGRVFEYQGDLYRPSQDCSKRYGYGLKLNRIVKLDEHHYEEVCVHSIEPTWERKIVATHTYNFTGQLTILDAVLERSRFSR